MQMTKVDYSEFYIIVARFDVDYTFGNDESGCVLK